jgi:tetratricopeptide (TPR) repeat protein
LIRAVAGMAEEELRGHLDRLGRSELAFVQGDPPAAVYIFKHALIQDAIYATMLKSERASVHEGIFTVLVEQFPELVAARPEVAAYHAENAGRREAAVPLLRDAGVNALGRTAIVEAVKHLAHGIELVDALDEPDRTRMEIELQAAIGPAYMATVGWPAPEVERSCARLRDLAAAKGDVLKLFQAMWGLWTVDFIRSRLDPALDMAKQVLTMAVATGDPMFQVAGHHAVGYTQFFRGAYTEALRHADEGLALFDLEREKQLATVFQLSSSVAMWSFRAEAQQILGFPEQAGESLRHWRQLVDDLRHPPSRAFSLWMECWFFRKVNPMEPMLAPAVALRPLALAEGFAIWVPLVDVYLAWANARQGGDAAVAVEKIESARKVAHQGLNYILETELAGLHAETLLLAGKPEQVFRVAEEALAITRPGKQRHYESDLFRIQGDAARAMGDSKRAATFYRHGLDLARAAGAKSLELRSAVGLVRLMGGTAERRELKVILDGFTEGFHKADFVEAAGLL